MKLHQFVRKCDLTIVGELSLLSLSFPGCGPSKAKAVGVEIGVKDTEAVAEEKAGTLGSRRRVTKVLERARAKTKAKAKAR